MLSRYFCLRNPNCPELLGRYRFVMLNGVKHLLCDRHAEEDPSLSLRMTKTKDVPFFPP